MPTLSIPPNFVSVRLTDADKREFKTVQDHIFKVVGVELPMADVYRLGMKALIEKHNLKVK